MSLNQRSAADPLPVLVPKNIEKFGVLFLAADREELVINREAFFSPFKPVVEREIPEEVGHVPQLVFVQANHAPGPIHWHGYQLSERKQEIRGYHLVSRER